MTPGRLLRATRILACLFLPLLLASQVSAQRRRQRTPPTPGPMLAQGTQHFDTPEFDLTLVRSSQTIASLDPKGANGFDFTPGDQLVARSRNGYYHLGDIDLRLRVGSSGDWKDYSTALARAPVTALPPSKRVLAAADLSATLPADIPLHVVREWALDNGKLVLRFILKNKAAEPVQIGALGIPMVFNNIITGRTLEEAHEKCSFYDPYIGEDAGYLQVTRLNGNGPALLVIPSGKTPFEAYKPILNPERPRGPQAPGVRPGPPEPQVFTDLTPRSNTFEGFYDWMVASQAFAENEWKGVNEWNPSTMITLAPGASRTFGVEFVLSDTIPHIEKTLTANHRPVAVGVPGYVLPTNLHARLFLNYSSDVASLSVSPEGAIAIHKDAPAGRWKAYTLDGKTWGRSRLTIKYRNGLVQTISYFVTKPEAEAVADMGHFLTTKQWFDDTSDPFHRAPSAITYDNDLHQQVTQDARVWIAGLSDEGGAGSWLATAMKEFGEPDPQELVKFQQFVDGVLWGQLQYKDGPRQYGVKKSLFYYQPDELPPGYYRSDINWKSWTSWNKQQASAVDRSYDYPHVAAAYWSMYRLARDHQGLVTDHPWQWYLDQAYQTTMGMMKLAPYYTRFGLMEGDVFVSILKDLKREGMTAQAADMEAAMKKRADRWKTEAYPFGSEMPWDSTGQEEVYAWMKYFGYEDKAEMTLNVILGYDPAIPSWGYNGSARRYWDFYYGGKAGPTGRLERQLHHYGSGLNAIPLLAEYRQHPDRTYLLRVGYGGTMGPLTDINQEGFAATAFHSFPDMMRFDGITGDYGPNFFGYAYDTATYILKHPDFGWIAFGGNLSSARDSVRVTPVDGFRMRVYVASLGLWLTLDSGKFDQVEINPRTGTVRVGLAAATQFTPTALLRVSQPAKIQGVGTYAPRQPLQSERGAFVVPLKNATTWIELTAK